MPFPSCEIRWFAEDRTALRRLYEALPPAGPGRREPDRTDYYLRTATPHTGVKIREGSHELKVKAAEDESRPYGLIEHWIKWSHPASENILNTLPARWLGDWLAVEKKRFKKDYAITGGHQLAQATGEWQAEGCGLEFTEIHLPDFRHTAFTLGFEAFSDSGNQGRNLEIALTQLPLDYHRLAALGSKSYPAFLIPFFR